MEAEEPLLSERGRRFVLFPIRYKAIWGQYKSLTASFWTVDNIQLKEDVENWDKRLGPKRKHAISFLLDVVKECHVVIHDPLLVALSTQITSPEARCYLGFQRMSENVHAEAISLLRTSLIADVKETDSTRLLSDKAAWSTQWAAKTTPFPERLIALAVIKSIFACTTTCLISCISTEYLDGLVYVSRRIAEDVEHHSDFACLLFHHVSKKPGQTRIVDIITEAVRIEKDFAAALLKCIDVDEGHRMRHEDLCQYIEFIADILLSSLGCDIFYRATNPVSSMIHTPADEKRSYFARLMEDAYAGLHTSYQREGYNIMKESEEDVW